MVPVGAGQRHASAAAVRTPEDAASRLAQPSATGFREQLSDFRPAVGAVGEEPTFPRTTRSMDERVTEPL